MESLPATSAVHGRGQLQSPQSPPVPDTQYRPPEHFLGEWIGVGRIPAGRTQGIVESEMGLTGRTLAEQKIVLVVILEPPCAMNQPRGEVIYVNSAQMFPVPFTRLGPHGPKAHFSYANQLEFGLFREIFPDRTIKEHAFLLSPQALLLHGFYDHWIWIYSFSFASLQFLRAQDVSVSSLLHSQHPPAISFPGT